MAWMDDLWKRMNRMQSQLDRMFNTFFDNEWRSNVSEDLSRKYRRAFTDFRETENGFVIQVELPGVEKKDIKLRTTKNGIEVTAQKKVEKEKGKKGSDSYSFSRSYAGFYQAFSIPEEADLSKIDATYKNGVLTIRLPKKLKIEGKKEIKIK